MLIIGWSSTWETMNAASTSTSLLVRAHTSRIDRIANLRLLERGTLYVARFHADGRGEWLALVHGQHGLDATAGFPGQAEVMVQTRTAADKVGATKMDCPWIAVHPTTKEVYCALTNNSNRGTDKGPAVDSANPRAKNVYGHIIRWREQDGDPKASQFQWDIFVLCGDRLWPRSTNMVLSKGILASPDGLWFDARGVLWIETTSRPVCSTSAITPIWVTTRC